MTAREPIPSRFWLDRARTRVIRWLKAGVGSGWVVAVSGGSDSIGLLRVLHTIAPDLGLRLTVAHLNHGARGEPADADAAFVSGLAESLALPFDLGHWKAERSAHFEADARRARYEWLLEVAQARGASVVAVGHNRDDQAETILQRILRGTGPRGLAGMPARRPLADSVTLLRPLLHATRQEIRDYLERVGQTFRDDATNATLTHTRARIRHDLLPKLAAEYNPAVAEALVRLGHLVGSSYRNLEVKLREMERVATHLHEHNKVCFNRDVLIQYPTALRTEVIRRAWRRAGWPEAGMSAEHWLRLAALARRAKGRIAVCGGIDAVISAGYLVLERSAEPSHEGLEHMVLALDVPGSVAWPGGRVFATFNENEPRDETIDFDRVAPPLRVRAPAPGDRFAPLGIEHGSMALNDFFRGRHVPRAQRARNPLVCDHSGIIWVIGHRIAQRVRLTDTTVRKLGLRWEAGAESAQAPEPSCD